MLLFLLLLPYLFDLLITQSIKTAVIINGDVSQWPIDAWVLFWCSVSPVVVLVWLLQLSVERFAGSTISV